MKVRCLRIRPIVNRLAIIRSRLTITPHIESGCASVTGGYVYRGVREVQMLGYYLFADFCDGKFYATNKFSAETPWQVTLVGGGAGNPTTFGEAANGELYVGMASGNIYRIKSAE